MAISLRPKYAQMGSTGKYEQYKMTERENLNLPFRLDTLEEQDALEEADIIGQIIEDKAEFSEQISAY